MARRRKKRKGHYHTGVHSSPKAGDCKYRSGWELLYMQYLDDNTDVIGYTYEETIIPYVSNTKTGKQRKYYPDFLVEHVSGTQQLVEIKPSRKLKQRTVTKKLLAAGDWCRANGITLVVITEVELKQMGLLK